MFNRHLILFSLIVGLFVGMGGSIYDPSLTVFAKRTDDQQDATTLIIMDRELKHVNEKFASIQNQLGGIRKKMDDMCDDITNVRIKAAESGGIYGGASALLVYLVGAFGKGLLKRKNGIDGKRRQ